MRRPYRRGFPEAAAGHLKCMFPAENLRDWRGEKVIDPEGGKIGDLEAVYVDTATDEPAFATVRVGIIGRHKLAFVPLVEERFDLLVWRKAWFDPPFQRLFAFCQAQAFAERAGVLGGYDVRRFGEVRFNGG